MRHLLHLLKDPANRAALDVIRAQAAQGELQLSVVLLDRARTLAEPLPGQVYQLEGPDAAPAPVGRVTIGPSELLDLIFAADTVVVW